MKKHCLSLFLLSIVLSAFAQGTVEDYKRADAADRLFRNKVFNAPASFTWLKDGSKFWYINTTRTGKEFIGVDVAKQAQQPLFDHAKLAKNLAQKSGKKVDPKALPFERIEFTPDQKSITFQVDSAKWRCNLSSYTCEVIEIIKKPAPNNRYWGSGFDETENKPVPSPDSLWFAFIKNSNLYIRNRKTKQESQLSYDGAAGNYYSSYIEWSPNSKYIMAYKVKPGEKHLIYFVESSPEDQLQPKLDSREYLKPGDILPHRQPQLFLVDEKKHIHIKDDLFPHQFSLSNIYWREDNRSFTMEYNERGHQRYRIVEVKAPSGETRIVVDERSETFIDYSGKKYRFDVNDGKEIIWTSERDGWNHLYLYDGVTGLVKNQVTKGAWPVRNVVYVDETKRYIIFAASGLDGDQDPYLLHYCKINFDGTGFTRLTTANVNHAATFSPDFKYFVDYQSRIDLPPISKLVRTDNSQEVMTLQQADISDLLKTGWQKPEVFSAKGRDGKTDIWGMIIKPSNFDPNKKYPVIEMIYAGPHSFFVPKNFISAYRGMQGLAELGFILVQIDGMGTSGRSKAFHNVSWKNLKDAGFPDRIAWMKAAAATRSYMDITKVGVYGRSAGGQNAAGAVIFHPEFYNAAEASCGCHDNRMDKIWWNEQWMGYPVGPQYAESSNITNAHKLGGKLMLIVGELDDNVDPASTMQLANALIKAKKDFELIVVPGVGHACGGEYAERKRRDFFVKNLLGVIPPDWSQVYK